MRRARLGDRRGWTVAHGAGVLEAGFCYVVAGSHVSRNVRPREAGKRDIPVRRRASRDKNPPPRPGDRAVRASSGRRRRSRPTSRPWRRARCEPSRSGGRAWRSFLAVASTAADGGLTLPSLIADTVPRPIDDGGAAARADVGRLRRAAGIERVTIPFAGRFEVTRMPSPELSIDFSPCGISCMRASSFGLPCSAAAEELTAGPATTTLRWSSPCCRRGRSTVSVTVYVPPFAKTCTWLGPTAVVPSPKFHWKLARRDQQCRRASHAVELDHVAALIGLGHDELRLQDDRPRARQCIRVLDDRPGVVELALQQVGVLAADPDGHAVNALPVVMQPRRIVWTGVVVEPTSVVVDLRAVEREPAVQLRVCDRREHRRAQRADEPSAR